MRKRKLRLALAILLLAVLGGLTWLVVAPHDPPEPVYQGKRLSELLHKMDGTILDRGREQAIREIGTNGIPTLLQMLRARDSKFKLRIIWLLEKQHFIEFNFNIAAQRNQEAARGLSLLGADASNAVPALIQIYEENISEWSQSVTAEVLGDIGPGAAAAVPALLRTVDDATADTDVRVNAALALGHIHTRPELVVPDLIKCLKDSNSDIRHAAAGALMLFGTDAKAAVPVLIDLLKDPYAYVRGSAEQALLEIDYEAATEAGVKRILGGGF